MILAAGALVLLGLGLFVAGVVTGTTAFYWVCVAACVVAGVLLVAARLQIGRAGTARPAGASPAATPPAAGPPTTSGGLPGTTGTAAGTAVTAQLPAAGATTAGQPVAEPSSAPPEPVQAQPPAPSSGAHSAGGAVAAELPGGEPAVEEVEVTDLLMVVDLSDEVLVVDEHPRYHLAGCPWLGGRPTVPLPVDEARTDGFTPCARCSPDRTLAERERARRGR